MQRHVSDQVSLVSKASVALWTLIGLLLGSWGNIGRVVIQVLMSLEQLLLSEALVALVTTEWFLVGVYEHVRLQVSLRDGGVGTQITLETLLTLVSLLVNFQSVPEHES